MDGWMDGWKGGWMDGGESRVKDCLQQSKITCLIDFIKNSLFGLFSNFKISAT